MPLRGRYLQRNCLSAKISGDIGRSPSCVVLTSRTWAVQSTLNSRRVATASDFKFPWLVRTLDARGDLLAKPQATAAVKIGPLEIGDRCYWFCSCVKSKARERLQLSSKFICVEQAFDFSLPPPPLSPWGSPFPRAEYWGR